MKKRPLRVLVIEDHQDIATLLVDHLEEEGCIADHAADGVSGLHLAVVNTYDVIILDLGLPGVDGLDLCERLRRDAGSRVPILMLTARDTLEDKLQGFERGADDYLVKPFELEEVMARVRVLHRRANPAGETDVFRFAGLVLDTGAHRVFRDSQPIDLKPIPFTMLEVLIRNAPNVVSRADMESAIWGDNPPDSDALRTHLAALRQAVDKPFASGLRNR